MESISAIIVDDEPLAREGLSIRLNAFGGFSILATCNNGADALEIIKSDKPDVVFVDIEMPEINGLEMIELLVKQPSTMPLVVFVTAFKEFAFKAFDCHAFDYLLKPYSEDRLSACLTKICAHFQQQKALRQQQELDSLLSRKTGKTLNGFIHTLNQTDQFGLDDIHETIALKSGNEWLRLKLENIHWLEAAGDYVCVHTSDENHIIRKTLKDLSGELCQRRFLRLNRSAIVNVSKIARLTPNSNGEYYAQLHDGSQVKVSRRYRLMIKELNAQP